MLSVKRQIVLRLGQHCCTQRVAHVWSPCSNMLLQGVVTFCSFITSYNAIQHYSKMLKCCVHLAAPLRAGFILTCHGLRTFHATGVFSSLTLKVILLAIVINAPCELAYLLLNRIMNYY